MIQSLKNWIKKGVVNIPGWRTDRKIVVIASDDWGAVRMASKQAYKHFLNKGYRVDQCPYNRQDSLESNEDLEKLLEVLHSVKDIQGRPACFTINNIVANPDFEKIRKESFETYYYEAFTETLKKYADTDKVLELYSKGLESKALMPQFHGREHVNVNRWMQDLNKADSLLLSAFENNMLSVHKEGSIAGRSEYMDAFGLGHQRELESYSSIVSSGLALFEKIWGYKSESFIAPCYTWPKELEPILKEQGVDYIQGTYVQRIPSMEFKNGVKRKHHFQGNKNALGQRYIIRNVFFEPFEFQSKDWINAAIGEIETAFRFRKPAVICSHRVNYIGRLIPESRDKNLSKLEELLKMIVKKHPETEFMSVNELGRLMSVNN